jgi:DNA-binding response OmpR family regulator
MNRIQSNLQKKILIIEDDNIIIKIIEHFLENEDYSVSVAQDGEVGLKKIIEDKPDLILLDIMVPSMSGLQLLEKLKEDTQLSQIPIIIISSLSQDEDILKGLEKGAMDYVPKPFSPQILIAKVKKYLD